MNHAEHDRARPLADLSEHAHAFVHNAMGRGTHTPGCDDHALVQRCAQHLMALAACSQARAETCAAQVVAEVASRDRALRFDLERSTAFALFVNDRQGIVHVISAARLEAILFR